MKINLRKKKTESTRFAFENRYSREHSRNDIRTYTKFEGKLTISVLFHATTPINEYKQRERRNMVEGKNLKDIAIRSKKC